MRKNASLVLFAVLVLAGCGACSEDQLTEISSPDNRYVATVFRRGCGATTGFLYHVNIRTANGSFKADYRGTIENGQIFLTREGRINISWKDDKVLQVSCSGCPKDPKPMMESSWKDVSVSYDLH